MKGSIERIYCEGCRKVHFRNPTVGVAVIVMSGKNLLFVRRKGSYRGKWCIPCGHVEWGEDVRKAAGRELLEETGLAADIGGVYDVQSNFHDPEQLTVGIWFLSKITGGELKAGSDASEASFFPVDNPPMLAFPTDRIIIEKLKCDMTGNGGNGVIKPEVFESFS